MVCCREDHCCCGCMHVKTGTVTIGLLMIAGTALGTVLLFGVHYLTSEANLQIPVYAYYIIVPTYLVSTLVGSLLIIGALNEKPLMLVPFIVLKAAEIIQAIVILGGLIYFCVNPGEYEQQYYDLILSQMEQRMMDRLSEPEIEEMAVIAAKVGLISLGIVVMLSIAIGCWLLNVVVKCYKCLKNVDRGDEAESVQMLHKA
ncbi:hypothetical protein L596_022218 [Steinernema carpocapsae]|uniref:Uncharacterized protein n=1 Tax=Steinernema carpocapsae TaxID=34508 RepID=A0A4U5ML39_STECR|nr:hypothetical protein L596_022218 [Steinernema carpocapsae]